MPAYIQQEEDIKRKKIAYEAAQKRLEKLTKSAKRTQKKYGQPTKQQSWAILKAKEKVDETKSDLEESEHNLFTPEDIAEQFELEELRKLRDS